MGMSLQLKKKVTMSKESAVTAMQEALKRFLKDRSSAKEFSVCMKESTQWLNERAK